MTRHFRVTAAITNARSGTVRRVAALRKVSRRTVLTTGAATVAAASMSGCGWENGAQATSAADDVALVTDALDDELAFAEMCEQVRRRYRQLAARIDVVISGQREHTDALTATLGQPQPTDTEVPISDNLPVTVISREAAILHERRIADCLASQAGPLAQLFASMAASHAVTAEDWRTTR